MTRPIYEPSLQRTDARLGYGQAQLFRRPSPPSSEFPLVFRAAIQSVPGGEDGTNREHYASADGGATVNWDTWDTSFDTSIYSLSGYTFTDPLTGLPSIVGVGLKAAGVYSIYAQVDPSPYFNGTILMNSNFDEGQAVYSEHNNIGDDIDLFLGDFYLPRVDHWRMVNEADPTPPSAGSFGGSANDVEIVFAQNNDADLIIYSGDPGTADSSSDPPTPGGDLWIPGGFDGQWGVVPQLVVKYWGIPSSGWDADWPASFPKTQ